MRKKVISLLLAVSMVGVLLAGCNEKSVEPEKKPVQTTSTAVTKKEAAHTELKKYMKKADKLAIVKDAKNLDLEKAVNGMIEESKKADIKTVAVDFTKVDRTKVGKYPVTITISFKDSSKEGIKDTVEVSVVEKKDAEKLAEEGYAVIGDDNKVTVKEAAKTAEADTKFEKEKKQDSDKKTEEKKEAAASDSKKSQTTTTKGNQGAAASNNSNQTTSKPASGTGNTTTQKPSGGNTGSGNPSATTPVPTPTPTPEPQKPSHVHNWVEQFHNVHHEATGHNEPYVVTEAWDEPVSEPIYEMQLHWYCNTCNEDITADPGKHLDETMHGGYWSEYIPVQTGTNEYTVHHDAVYGTRWVQDSAAWNEPVSDGYRCSGCNATK